MAIAATVLASGNDTTDGTSFATASVSPAANSLLLVFTASSDATTAPTITTSGLSLTWTQQKDQPFGSSTTDVRRLAAFTAQCGATPGSGAITFTMSATSTHCAWVVVEITGHDTTTPVPQVVGNKDDSTSATSLTLTLAAGQSADSRPFSWWGVRDNVNGTPATGWTELYDEVVASPSMGHEAQWRSDAFDTSPSVTWDLPQRIGGIAVEIAAASSGTTAEVLAVTATATATTSAPIVSGETSVAASVRAQATAQALAPTVTATGGSTVLAVTAQATSAALAPTLSSIVTGSVAAAAAAATALAGTPTVAGVTNAQVSATLITATAQAVDPTVSVVGAGQVTVPAGAATAAAQAPTVAAVINVEVVAVVATATAQAEAPSNLADSTISVVAVTATATALALAPTSSSTTFFIFEPPTYFQPAPPPPGVRRSLYSLRESMSVVRINGTFVSVKTPFVGVLTAAGVEGEDYFLGGRIYRVSTEIADELTTAGYTLT